MTAARNVLSKRQTRGRSRIREQLQNARQRLLPLSPEQNELRRVSIRVRKVREEQVRGYRGRGLIGWRRYRNQEVAALVVSASQADD